MLPSGPALGPSELVSYEEPTLSGAVYTDAPLVPYPVIPFQVFGLYYDIDLVIVSRNTGWDMHEYARIQTPGGAIWMAKDSRPDGVQTIVSDVENLPGLVAEVPVPRVQGSVDVNDSSIDEQIDVTLRYANPDGVETEVRFEGQLPRHPPSRRNGSTMGHSRQAVAAVLDLERFGTRNRAEMTMNGEEVGIQRIAGVVPMVYLLQQAQGGFAISSWDTTGDAGAFVLNRPSEDGPGNQLEDESGWPTSRQEVWFVSDDEIIGDFGLNRITYRFQDRELVSAQVSQFGRETPVFELFLTPALPDLSRPFEGQVTSQFRMDINGQRGHGTGTIHTQWDDDQVEIQIIPSAPWWLADRPMHGGIVYPGPGRTEAWMERSVLPE